MVRGRINLRYLQAFTIVEVLIAVIITTLLGGIAVTVMWLFFGTFSQVDDHSSSTQEMEFAFQVLGRQFTHIALGMPNSRMVPVSPDLALSTFSESFRTSTGSRDHPIMELMGRFPNPGRNSGPLVIGKAHTYKPGENGWIVDQETTLGTATGFSGTTLYYTWAVPMTSGGATLKVDRSIASPDLEDGTTVNFTLLQPNGVRDMVNFHSDGAPAGITSSGDFDTRSWIVFPTLRIPMLLTGIHEDQNRITVVLAPGIRAMTNLTMTGTLGGLEDIHLVRSARIYVNDREELIQEFYEGQNYTTMLGRREVLARNISSVFFFYDPARRLLTMYVAARGGEHQPSASSTGLWPPSSEDFSGTGWDDTVSEIRLSSEDSQYRILVGERTWRIRN